MTRNIIKREKKVYVVKVFYEDAEPISTAFCTSFKKALEIARQGRRNWVIEEWPMDKGRLLPWDRREAWYCDLMVGDKLVPAGTLIGPYDAQITMQKR